MSSVKDKAAAAAHTVSPTPPVWGHIMGIGAFLVIVVFIPAWGEIFTMPKVVLLTAFAFAAVPLIWTRWHTLATHRVPAILAAAFAGLALVSQFLSGAPQLVSLWGEWSRRTGTITALALALLVITASLLTRREVGALLAWMAWAGVPATVYGLVQVAGADPLEWTDQGWVVATFGNPNFAAAGMGMLALLTAGLAAFGDYRTLWRILMAPLAALEAFVALQTGSSQAVFALAAGIGAGALVWLMRGDGPNRLRSVPAVAAVGMIGAGLTLAALFGIGPLVSAISSDTLMFRQWYWGAALGMADSHPIVGVGPDGYGRFYGEFRSEQAAEMFTLGASAAHDVPLQWAATLGIPAALVYVALMAAVAILVIRRLWAQGGEASPLVIPVFAVWAAYQVQSLVSIDAIPIAMLGWLTTGVLLAASRPETTPGATRAGSWVAAGVLGLAGVLVWLPATLASNASKTVVQGTTEADVLQAISLVEGTTLPCDPSVRVGRWMVDVAASEPTITAVFTGAEADNRCYGLVNAAADFAIQLERPEQALALAEQAVAIDPLNYATWILLARAEHLNGNDPEARSALQRAEDINPNAVAEIEAISEDLGLS